ncbi:hypothetical protein H0X09_03955 [Candidatus Saccharibacteria bacterium]|nr:hypothetical protein [Candidatus Saccharibacteria bacterium]
MALFRRRNVDQSGNSLSQIEFNDTNERRWPMMLAALAAALLIALILFYVGRWAYRSIIGNDAEPTPVAPIKQDSSPTQQGANPQSGTLPTQGSGPSPSPNPPSTIVDSGPGDIAALFIGTSLAAAGLHYVISLRRSARMTS